MSFRKPEGEGRRSEAKCDTAVRYSLVSTQSTRHERRTKPPSSSSVCSTRSDDAPASSVNTLPSRPSLSTIPCPRSSLGILTLSRGLPSRLIVESDRVI